MKVPFFDLTKLYFEGQAELEQAALRALRSGHYILGKELETLERSLQEQLAPGDASAAVVGCNSGTDALVLPLLAVGVGAGHEVIVPSLTAVPTITAIRSVGATPVFCDIDPQSWVLDVRLLESLATPKTRAIVPVHLYGNMVDTDQVLAVLERLGRTDIAVIEDVAQAHGATLRGRQAGTIGDYGAFSFYPTKNLGALGDAGAVFYRKKKEEVVRYLRNYGQEHRYLAKLDFGRNSRLDEVQAAVLSARMPHMARWNSIKNGFVERYRAQLSGLPISFQKVTDDCSPAWHLFVVATRDQATRDRLMAHLEAQGVQALIHYPTPNHLQPAFAGIARSALPVTEDLSKRILSLPMNPILSSSAIDYVIAQVRGFFSP
jgi:dTDP-4-amino-4,6-dideoxygalactose transaminase